MTKQDYVQKIYEAHDSYLAVIRNKDCMPKELADAALKAFNSAHDEFKAAMPDEYSNWLASAFDEE